MATAAYLENEPSELRGWLEKARKVAGPPITEQMEWLELEARVAFKQGRAENALRQFYKLEKISREHFPTTGSGTHLRRASEGG